MRVVGLLTHGAEEAGELREGSRQDAGAKIDVAEQAVQRIGELAIRRCAKEPPGHLGKMLGRRDREVFLAFEVVEERALGQAGCGTDVVHGGPRIALRADHLHCRVEETSPRIGMGGCCVHAVSYQPVGINVNGNFELWCDLPKVVKSPAMQLTAAFFRKLARKPNGINMRKSISR